MRRPKRLEADIPADVVRPTPGKTKRRQDSADRPDPHESFGHLIRDLHRSFSRTLQELVAQHGITTAQWFFLRVLWDEDGLTQAVLSDRVGLTTATTVVALNNLEKKGLIERQHHPSDGRKFIIKLTSRGRKMEQKLRPSGKMVNDFAGAGLPKDVLLETKRVLQTMRANLIRRSDSKAKSSPS